MTSEIGHGFSPDIHDAAAVAAERAAELGYPSSFQDELGKLEDKLTRSHAPTRPLSPSETDYRHNWRVALDVSLSSPVEAIELLQAPHIDMAQQDYVPVGDAFPQRRGNSGAPEGLSALIRPTKQGDRRQLH